MPLAYALIHREAGVSGISFPDFPGLVATGRTADEAIRKGSEALSFHVAGMVEDGYPLPDLRPLDALQRDPEFHADAEGGVVALIQFDLPAKAVGINISIDEHLLGAIDRAASAAGQSLGLPRRGGADEDPRLASPFPAGALRRVAACFAPDCVSRLHYGGVA